MMMTIWWECCAKLSAFKVPAGISWNKWDLSPIGIGTRSRITDCLESPQNVYSTSGRVDDHLLESEGIPTSRASGVPVPNWLSGYCHGIVVLFGGFGIHGFDFCIPYWGYKKTLEDVGGAWSARSWHLSPNRGGQMYETPRMRKVHNRRCGRDLFILSIPEPLQSRLTLMPCSAVGGGGFRSLGVRRCWRRVIDPGIKMCQLQSQICRQLWTVQSAFAQSDGTPKMAMQYLTDENFTICNNLVRFHIENCPSHIKHQTKSTRNLPLFWKDF